MRRVTAVLLAAFLAYPPVSLNSAPSYGVVEGRLTVDGRPVSGLDLALVDVRTGAVHRARSGRDGAFQMELAPGSYVFGSRADAGLAVGRAPTLVRVEAGRVASARLDLAALPLALLQDPNLAPEIPPGINHQEIGCFIAGQFPLVDAVIEPMTSVVRSRVYFKAAGTEDYFYVEMTPDIGQFVGKLPRPRLEASPITYYIQATTTEGDSQTPEIQALVVENEGDCEDRRVAAIGPPGPVQVFSATTGTLVKPIGFAAGAVGLSALTIALLAGGALAIGIGTAVVINNPPASPSPSPSPTPEPPIPTPEPTPSPSPEPTPETGPPPPASPTR